MFFSAPDIKFNIISTETFFEDLCARTVVKGGFVEQQPALIMEFLQNLADSDNLHEQLSSIRRFNDADSGVAKGLQNTILGSELWIAYVHMFFYAGLGYNHNFPDGLINDQSLQIWSGFLSGCITAASYLGTYVLSNIFGKGCIECLFFLSV